MKKLIIVSTVLCVTTLTQAEVRRVAATAIGNQDGQTWSNAYTKVEDALAAAQTGDEIWVAEGTYFPNQGSDRTASFALKSGVALLGGFRGHETTVDQRNSDPRTNGTVLSGDIGVSGDATDNAFHVLTGVGTDRTALLSGFTITLGYSDGDSGLGQTRGAGLWLGNVIGTTSGSPTLSDCRFVENSGDLENFFGGGGAVFGPNGSSPMIERCLFENNSSVDSGAGINVFGGFNGITSVAANPEIRSCVFVGNVSLADGGAVKLSNLEPSTAVMELCHFEENSALAGGALSFSSDLVVTRCSFVKNTASNDGGAISVSDNQASPKDNRFISCQFEQNLARNDGGAALLRETPVRFSNCVFAGNSALSDGGAIYTLSGATPAFVNCSFSGNKANALGGAIRNFSSSTVTLQNCVLWSNFIRFINAVPGASVDTFSNSTTIFANTLVEHFDLSSQGQAALDGTNPDNAPQFAKQPAAGEAGNLRLQDGSPALNAGNDGFNSTEVDIANRPRKVGVIDLGAFEGGHVTFASLYGAANPLADDNGNGRSNFEDYAGGLDPSTPTLQVASASFSLTPTGLAYQHTIRAMAADAVPSYLTSGVLHDFAPMLQGIDFALPVFTTVGPNREQVTLALPLTGARQKWFRHAYVVPVP